MRVLILTLALAGLAMPALADCLIHQASKPDTVATTTPQPPPAPAPPAGG